MARDLDAPQLVERHAASARAELGFVHRHRREVDDLDGAVVRELGEALRELVVLRTCFGSFTDKRQIAHERRHPAPDAPPIDGELLLPDRSRRRLQLEEDPLLVSLRRRVEEEVVDVRALVVVVLLERELGDNELVGAAEERAKNVRQANTSVRKARAASGDAGVTTTSGRSARTTLAPPRACWRSSSASTSVCA